MIIPLQVNDTISSNNSHVENNQLYILVWGLIVIIIVYFVIDFFYRKFNKNQDETIHYFDLSVDVEKPKVEKSKEVKPKIEKPKEVKPKEEKPKDIVLKKIGYIPNNIFKQDEPYTYPVVKFPKDVTPIKFPRNGRSNKKGYKEDDFFIFLDSYFSKHFKVFNDKHIPQQNDLRPYEPDFILCTEVDNKNIFINIEIDEPYDGVARTPTHIVNQDIYRDLFFTNRGYIVIRFTEKQVHQQPIQCCQHIAKVIKSIETDFEFTILETDVDLLSEPQWDSLQAKKWAWEKYRENYLGIQFGIRQQLEEVIISKNTPEDEIVESLVNKSNPITRYVPTAHLEVQHIHERDARITFNHEQHLYKIDNNPDTISVSQLIDRFFPEFDSYTAAANLNPNHELFGMDVDDIVDIWTQNGNEQANLGTQLHAEIENFYNHRQYDNSQIEFEYFQNFLADYPTMVPYRTEWRIYDEELMIAGTIDMVYIRPNGDCYIFDWKRSKKVVDQYGQPKISDPNGAFTQFATGELSHLTNDSYNKYLLQQNIYRHILETKYNIRISSMNLLILHPDYDRYHLVQLPRLENEVNYILNTSRLIT